MKRRNLFYYEFDVQVGSYSSFTCSLISEKGVCVEAAEMYFLDYINNYIHGDVSINRSWRSTRRSALMNILIINVAGSF